jgi:hypothetical protein
MSMRLWILVLAGSLVACSVHAANESAEEAQRRERLEADRAAAQARYDAALRECQSAFAVTGCVDRAKAERRGTMDRLAREEAALDDLQRRRRAEERRKRIAAKQQASAARAAASAPDVRLREPRLPSLAASASRPSRRAEPRSAQEAAAEETAARERATDSQRRRERAAEHQEAVRQRNAERAARKPPAAPLPDPTAAPPAPRASAPSS